MSYFNFVLPPQKKKKKKKKNKQRKEIKNIAIKNFRVV